MYKFNVKDGMNGNTLDQILVNNGEPFYDNRYMIKVGMNLNIGVGVSISIKTVIKDNVIIGGGVTIGKNVFIDDNVILGEGCTVLDGTQIPEGVYVASYSTYGREVKSDTDSHCIRIDDLDLIGDISNGDMEDINRSYTPASKLEKITHDRLFKGESLNEFEIGVLAGIVAETFDEIRDPLFNYRINRHVGKWDIKANYLVNQFEKYYKLYISGKRLDMSEWDIVIQIFYKYLKIKYTDKHNWLEDVITSDLIEKSKSDPINIFANNKCKIILDNENLHLAEYVKDDTVWYQMSIKGLKNVK